MQRASLSGVMAGRREWRAGHERWAGKCASASHNVGAHVGFEDVATIFHPAPWPMRDVES